MSAVLDRRVEAAAGPASWRAVLGLEIAKTAAQGRIQALVALCAVVPGVVVVGLSLQSTLPTDTVFGRWIPASGWAGALVVLAFCGTWMLPLLTAVVAGDAFAQEDRLGTWRHLLLAVRSRRRIFGAKVAIAAATLLMLVVLIAVSSVVGGLLSVGPHPLVGLDGTVLTSHAVAVRVLAAWVSVLPATAAFAAIGVLGAVLAGRSPLGLLAPVVVGLGLQLLQLAPLPAVVRLALPSAGFLAWRGLFTAPAQTAVPIAGALVATIWTVVLLAIARHCFVRTETVLGEPVGAARAGLVAAAVAALVGGGAGVLAATTPAAGSGIHRAPLEASLAESFAHLYRRQSAELGRPDVAEADLRARASCDRGGPRGVDDGPGHDWRCVVRWRLPGVATIGRAIYQLDVAPDGRYVADGDGPTDVNGYFLVRTDLGDAPNPLWQVDGLVDLLAAPTKG
ncbi:ABC transporter permease [Nocardioides fonticola]|uniref:ABC transporter permease n=1 Tax=Nocardioides fonticola TaxID=450363 RepID=A0ABP7XGM9_9ACTN